MNHQSIPAAPKAPEIRSIEIIPDALNALIKNAKIDAQTLKAIFAQHESMLKFSPVAEGPAIQDEWWY